MNEVQRAIVASLRECVKAVGDSQSVTCTAYRDEVCAWCTNPMALLGLIDSQAEELEELRKKVKFYEEHSTNALSSYEQIRGHEIKVMSLEERLMVQARNNDKLSFVVAGTGEAAKIPRDSPQREAADEIERLRAVMKEASVALAKG